MNSWLLLAVLLLQILDKSSLLNTNPPVIFAGTIIK